MKADPTVRQVPLVPGTFETGDDSGGPHLLGSHCRACEHTFFPRMVLCPLCHGETGECAIGRTATLYSFTVAHTAPVGFEAPYYQAYVDLPEGPRVFALIGSEVPVSADGLKEGMALELVIEPVRREDGQSLPAFESDRGRLPEREPETVRVDPVQRVHEPERCLRRSREPGPSVRRHAGRARQPADPVGGVAPDERRPRHRTV